MEIRNIVTQMQESRVKEAQAKRAAVSPATATTGATTTAVAASSNEAYKLDVGSTTSQPKAKTAAERYGSFYQTSPNGDKLAKMRDENETRVKQRMEGGT